MKARTLGTIISVLGVVLTAASVVASVAQYNAAQLQAKAAVVALMPQIEVRELLEKVDSDKYTDKRIEVSSDVGAIYNFELSRLSWIEFRTNDHVAFEQALSGYYFAEYPTGHTHGALEALQGYRNNSDYALFRHWAEEALGPGVDIREPMTLLKMTYQDVLKQNNVSYVLVSSGAATQMSDAAGKALWDRRILADKDVADLSEIKGLSTASRWLATWKSKLAQTGKAAG